MGVTGRRLTLAGGLVAVMAAIILTVRAAPASSISSKCPAGETEDVFTMVCLPDVAPSVVQMTTAEFGGVPEIDGVPCTGHNSYECIGLGEEQLAEGPAPSARSTVSSSP
jgi:hypothetical protein